MAGRCPPVSAGVPGHVEQTVGRISGPGLAGRLGGPGLAGGLGRNSGFSGCFSLRNGLAAIPEFALQPFDPVRDPPLFVGRLLAAPQEPASLAQDIQRFARQLQRERIIFASVLVVHRELDIGFHRRRSRRSRLTNQPGPQFDGSIADTGFL